MNNCEKKSFVFNNCKKFLKWRQDKQVMLMEVMYHNLHIRENQLKAKVA